jgi:hypothetical protein
MPEDIFNRPELSGGLAPELNRDLIENLDRVLAQQEARTTRRINQRENERGFLQSGPRLESVAEEVLGPAQDRRQQALLGLTQQSAQMGREDRVRGEDFQRTRQLQEEAFERRLIEMQKQADIQMRLLELQDELSSPGFGDFAGSLIGTGVGAAFGGVGMAAGGALGRKMFGGGGSAGFRGSADPYFDPSSIA